MVTLIHRSPMGALEIPGVGVIDRETPFEVTKDVAANLLEQEELYELVKPKAPAKPRGAKPAAAPKAPVETTSPTTTQEAGN